MGEQLFSVSINGRMAARDMELQDMILFVKALFEQFYAESDMHVTVRREICANWLPHPTEKDWRVCPVCGTGTEIVRHENGGTTEYGYRYCPWCGALLEAGAAT